MATTRVYKLSRELNVKSSAIVGKCLEEGLDVKNHMSVISAGLAATIREWFSEGENITTLETASKVNLKKVRIKKNRKAKTPASKTKAKQPEQPSEEDSSGTTDLKKAKPKKPRKKQSASAAKSKKKPAARAVEKTKKPVAGGKKTRKKKSVKKEIKSEKLEIITPAGPVLKNPAPAALSGPTVVRVERPEPVRLPPRRRPKSRPTRRDEPVTEPLIHNELDQQPTFDKPGQTKKDRTHGRRGVTQRHIKSLKSARTVKKWGKRDIEERRARLEAARGEGLRARPSRKIATQVHRDVSVHARPKKVTISEPVIVKDLSAALAVKSAGIIRKLMEQGLMVTANQVISVSVAEIIALEFGTELTVERKRTREKQISEDFEKRPRKHLKKRCAVVTMLGHVDHGKTSLLDKIRSTHVTAAEAGGITQHIGAYQVSHDGKKITFLDTPGHEAFTAMRARGANVTDIVVLVVAVDDGVMPQTVEAINHARAADVPVVVALNKTDLPGCDYNRIYSQLAEHDLTPVDWGGKTDVVKTSAVTGEGIDDLLDHIDYAAELLELNADDTIPATGWVIEAEMSSSRGPVARLLVKEGKLNKTDIVLAGKTYGRVKSIKDSRSRSLKVATSSMPVEITGLNGVPQANDRFYCLDDINLVKAAAEENQSLERDRLLTERTPVTLENLFSQIEAGRTKELNLIIKADVQGSVDVLMKYLSELSTQDVKIKILHAAAGGITEGDIVLAEASDAIIIGFNVVAEEHAARNADACGVDIRLYDVIYRIAEDLEKSMTGLLEPEEKDKNLGRAVVREIFRVSKIGTIAGCYISDGLVNKNSKVRLIRDSVVLRNNSSMDSLRRFQDDARQVKSGMECGIKITGYDDIKVDDVLEFYEVIKVKRTLR